MILLGLIVAGLAACTTELPPGASCNARWAAYTDDRINGALIGGMFGKSLSGHRPDC